MKTSFYAIDYVLPTQVVKTSELMDAANTERLGISNKLIERVLGIEEVRHASAGVTAVDLAVEAAEKNFQNSDIRREEIDMIIYTGIEGQYVEPSTAHFIQQRLGIKNAMAFDTPNACMGFITGLQIAHWAIQSGQIRYALICSGEAMVNLKKKVIDSVDRLADKNYLKDVIGYFTLSDSGGSVILGPSEDQRGILGFNTSSYGEFANLCYYKYDSNKVFQGVMIMDKICHEGTKKHIELFPDTIEKFSLYDKKIACLITHQVGKKTWNLASKVFNISKENMIKTYDKLGNLTSVTPIVNLSEAMNKKYSSSDFILGAFCRKRVNDKSLHNAKINITNTMWFFLSLTILSLLIKITTVTFVWKSKRKDLLFKLIKFLIVVSIIQSSLELYSYTPLEEVSNFIALLFLKSYYFCLLLFNLLLLVVTRLLIADKINPIMLVLGIFFFALISTLLYGSNLLIYDYRLLSYSITRVPGQYYWLLQLTLVMSVALVLFWLFVKMKSTSDHFTRAKCANMLIAFIPLGLFMITILIIMQLGFEVNAIGFMPLFISIYLAMIVWNLTAKRVPDYSFLIPGTPKQKLIYKMLRNICTLESKDQPINPETYQSLLVKYAVEVSKGNQREAAKLLNTSPSTVSRVMRKIRDNDKPD